MAKTNSKTINEYIATFSADIQYKLHEVRKIIHDAVPEAVETISYQIPYFQKEGPILYISAFKNHRSLAAPPSIMPVFRSEFTAYKTSVSVVQISYNEPLPHTHVTKMAKYREVENLKSIKK